MELTRQMRVASLLRGGLVPPFAAALLLACGGGHRADSPMGEPPSGPQSPGLVPTGTDPMNPPANPTLAPRDRAAPTGVAEVAAFLLTGPNASPQGLVPGALDRARQSIVRGQVTARNGAPLPGVTVSALGQSSVGHTNTAADGT